MNTNWLVSCSIGTASGLVLATGLTLTAQEVLPTSQAWACVPLVLVLALAGALWGAVLGHFQYPHLAQLLPGLPRPQWLRASTAAGATVWAVGLLPTALPLHWQAHFWAEAGSDWFWVWALAATVLWLFGIGAAQALVLRAWHPKGAGAWLRANALGWALGLLVVALTVSLIAQPAPPALVYGAIGLACVVGLLLFSFVTRIALNVLARPARGAPMS